MPYDISGSIIMLAAIIIVGISIYALNKITSRED
jgi:hypothetical protein